MRVIYADLLLANGREESVAPVATRARVDPSECHLRLSRYLSDELALEVRDRRVPGIGTEQRREVDYVGPIRLQVGDRRCWTGAVVDGEEAILGLMASEAMDLVADPALGAVTVNPSSPHMPRSLAVGVRTLG